MILHVETTEIQYDKGRIRSPRAILEGEGFTVLDVTKDYIPRSMVEAVCGAYISVNIRLAQATGDEGARAVVDTAEEIQEALLK